MPKIQFIDLIGPQSQNNPPKRQRFDSSGLIVDAWAKELTDGIPREEKKEEWLKVLEHDGSKLSWADPSFHTDPECIRTALKQNITSLDDMYSSTENLRPIIEEETLKLIKKNPSLIAQCEELAKQIDFIKKAIETNALTYCYLSLSSKENEALASLAVKNMGSLLKFLPLAFKSNSAIVSLAITNNIDSFLYANGQLKANPEFILNAIKINPKAFNFASNNLKADPDFVSKARKINPKILNDAADTLKIELNFLPAIPDLNLTLSKCLLKKT